MRTPFVCISSCLLVLATSLAAQTAPAQVDTSQLTVDAASKTATFQLVAAQTNLNSGLNFNGFNDGKLTLTVPQNWNVVIQFVNKDPNLPHSVEVVDTAKPMPAGPMDPAFPRAMTTKLMVGHASGEAETFKFLANKPGSYMLFCAVPGHGLAGMWIRLTVSPTDKRPALTSTP